MIQSQNPSVDFLLLKNIQRITQRCYLVGGIDVGTDCRPAGLEHVWGTQRRGGHGGSTLQPAILLQIRQFETTLWVYCE